jgi:hypothetical protein
VTYKGVFALLPLIAALIVSSSIRSVFCDNACEGSVNGLTTPGSILPNRKIPEN